MYVFFFYKIFIVYSVGSLDLGKPNSADNRVAVLKKGGRIKKEGQPA